MKIAIQNLNLYNNGELLFTWLNLPASEEEIEAALNKIHVGPDHYNKYGEPMEEYMIGDWEFDSEVEKVVIKDEMSCYSNLNCINEKAKFCQIYSDEDADDARGIQSITGDDIEDVFENYIDTRDYIRMDIWEFVEEYLLMDKAESEKQLMSSIYNYLSDNEFADFLSGVYPDINFTDDKTEIIELYH